MNTHKSTLCILIIAIAGLLGAAGLGNALLGVGNPLDRLLGAGVADEDKTRSENECDSHHGILLTKSRQHCT